MCVYIWCTGFTIFLGHGSCTAERRKKKCCFDQELGRTKDGVNCTRRSFPVKRWMDKYMGLIFFFKHKLKKEHLRVDCRVTDST